MNKKGFTLVELLAVIIIIGVLATVAVFSYNKVIDNSRGKAFKDNEKLLKTGAETLLAHCASSLTHPDFCVDIPENGEAVRIDLNTIVEAKFMNKITSPYQTGSYCDGYVNVTNKNGKTKLEYKTCLICGKVKSSDCQ